MPSPHEAILAQFRQLKSTWPARGWSYDDRFECVASSFDGDFAAQAKLLLQPLFPESYTERTLPNASSLFRQIAERTGGLRSSQMLFGGVGNGRVTPYGLWWPWEEAKTISLRVGLAGASPLELQGLCECFGIQP